MGRVDCRNFVYGGVSAVIAEFGTFPIDTTRTRLQIQGSCVNGKVVAKRYRGMLHALLKISTEEGVRALYYGIAPAVLRQSTYGTMKFGIYYTIKKIACPPGQESMPRNIVCGVTAGVIASSIANPTDVLKIRLQSGQGGAEKGLVKAFQTIYNQEGIRGLWKGVSQTAQRAGVIVGVELPLYDFCKWNFIRKGMPDSASTHLLSSFIASLGGAIASTPIDVVRTRLMTQRKLLFCTDMVQPVIPTDPSTHYYKGSWDCLTRTVRQEGLTALYKGFVPTWLRLGPWNMIFFVIFERLKKIE